MIDMISFYLYKLIKIEMANHAREDIKKVMKGTYPSAARFWREHLDAFQDSQAINAFCMKLFEQVIKSSKDQFLDDDHEAMYSTLMILQFYKNTKLKSEKWMEDTQKLYSDNNPKLSQHAKWIIKFYMKSAEDSQFALNFISSLCHIPEKFSWQLEPGQQIEEALRQAHEYSEIIELKRRDKPYKKLAQIAFDSYIKQSKIASFSYCCFMDYLRSTNFQPKKKIWTHILDIFKGLIHALRTSPKAYQLMTIFLHFISILIKFHGCAYEQILKQLIYLVNLQRNSPGINHAVASELFQIIHSELKSPGYCFRKEIKRRFVNIDFKKAETLGSKKYYITYRKITFNNPEYCGINNLRKLVIYNILGCFKVQNINKLWSVVETLDTQTTFDLYYKIMRILDITFNLQTYQSIHKLTRQNIAQLFKATWKPYRKLRKEQQNQLADLIVPQHTQRFFQFPNFQLVNIRPDQLVAQNNQHSIIQLFQEIKQYPYNEFFFSSFLELIFLGNDEELFRLLQLICDFLIKVPPCQYQKLVIYLIPIRDGQCDLAQYLATKDIWYRRHVYNVFRERLLMPYVSLEDPQIKDTFPSYLYTKSFHMYLRQAQRKVPFQIFQCAMSIEDTSGKKYNTTVYFINNVLMGLSLQSRIANSQIRKEKDKKNNYVDPLQIYLDKIKRVSPISIDLTVRYKEPGTEIMITTDQKFLLIEDLQICNTPKEYFFGYKPNPLNEYIQLSLLTQNASKVFRTELQTKQNFKRHSDEQIAQSFRDLYINLTAETIIIERSEGMKDYFRLLIDSVEYKDVQKFKISPVYTRQKLPLTLPVRCFLPFEV